MKKTIIFLSIFLSSTYISADSLYKYAQLSNKFIGTAVNTSSGFYSGGATNLNFPYTKILLNDFNEVVAENEFKMQNISTSSTTYNFSKSDLLTTFAQTHNMRLRGHTLVWYSQLPSWLGGGSTGYSNNNNYTRQQLLAIMKNYITTVVGRYAGKVAEWDVVNEAFEDNGQLRNSIWKSVIGEDYIDSAFVYAHRADPNAILYMNDYSNEEYGSVKGEAMYNLVNGLVNKGIPINGVGLQCHLVVNSSDFSKIDQNVKRYAAINLKCIVTELDIRMSNSQYGSSMLQAQANNYASIANIWMNNDNMPSLVVWGFTDAYSWIPGWSNNTMGYACIYDANLSPKQAYTSILNLLSSTSDTKSISVDALQTKLSPSVTNSYLTFSSKQTDDNSLWKIQFETVTGSVAKVFTSVSNNQSLNISDLSKGLYLVVISDRNGRGSVQKIIKN